MLNSGQIQVLRLALQRGLPICAQPYQGIAAELGASVDEVLEAIERLCRSKLIKRFGVVVRHQELGYNANAMVVWDVPDTQVDAVGEGLGADPQVSLSYRRPRRLPHWPFNLFCMIHGKDRRQVLAILGTIIAQQGLEIYPHRVLFSTRRYKQQGADYVGTVQLASAACCAK